jgi:hypothetical protein
LRFESGLQLPAVVRICPFPDTVEIDRALYGILAGRFLNGCGYG